MFKHYLAHGKPDEKIILLLRRHPLILTTKISFWVVVALMPLAVYLILGEVVIPIFLNHYVLPVIILFTGIYYLYIWLFAFHTFIDYYLDVWIVTNHRVINVEQKGLFHRTVSEQELHRIQDVTSELKGMFSTMFDYGTIYIQTAGEEPRFVFKQIPRPYQNTRTIIKLVEENKKLHHILDQQSPPPPKVA